MNKKKLLFVFAVCMFAGLILLLLLRGLDSPIKPEEVLQPEKATEVSIVASGLPLSPMYNWGIGNRSTYSLNTATMMGDPSAGWTASSLAGKVELSGRLHVRVLNIDPTTIVVGAQLSLVRFRADGNTVPEIESGLIAAPFIAYFDPTGALHGLDFPTRLPPEFQALLRGVMDIQVVVPAIPSREWKSEEIDANGVFSVNYQTLADRRINRMRNNYIRLEQENAGLSIVLKDSSYLAAVGGAWLQTYVGDEGVSLVDQSGVPVSLSHVSKELTEIDTESEPIGLATLMTGRTASELKADLEELSLSVSEISTIAEKRHREELENRYSDMLLDEVLLDLLKAVSNSQTHAETIPAMEKMRDWLLVNPEQALNLAQRLVDPAFSPEATARIVHAFELSASSKESQEALASILGNPSAFPETVLAQAAVASGGLGEIQSQELYDALFQTAFDLNSGNQEIQDAALLALGTLSQTNSGIADVLISSLANNLNPSEDVLALDRIVALQTLSNGGLAQADIVESARALLKGDLDAAVRSEALSYLNTTEQMSSSDILLGLADIEDNVQLRAAEIVRTSRTVEPRVVDQLFTLALTASEPEGTRVAAVTALGQHSSSEPRIQTGLTNILQSNPSGAIKEAVRSALKLQEFRSPQ